MQEPWLLHNCVPKYLEEEEIAAYFAKIFNQTPRNARRRECYGATMNYEMSITNLLKAGKKHHER